MGAEREGCWRVDNNTALEVGKINWSRVFPYIYATVFVEARETALMCRVRKKFVGQFAKALRGLITDSL